MPVQSGLRLPFLFSFSLSDVKLNQKIGFFFLMEKM